MQGAAAPLESLLDRPEAPRELGVGGPEGRLRIDAQLAGGVGDGEEQIAHLFLDLRAVAARDRVAQLGHLFIRLVDDLFCLAPVESDVGGARSDACRPQQRRQRLGDAVEQGGAIAGGAGPLLALDPLPLPLDLDGGEIAGRGAASGDGVAEDVGVPPDELGGHRLGRVGNGEVAILGADLGHEYRFEQEVSELVAQGGAVVAIHRFDHFVGLFEHEGPERGHGLFAIPGAAVR